MFTRRFPDSSILFANIRTQWLFNLACLVLSILVLLSCLVASTLNRGITITLWAADYMGEKVYMHLILLQQAPHLDVSECALLLRHLSQAAVIRDVTD